MPKETLGLFDTEVEGEVQRTLFFDEATGFSIVLIAEENGTTHKICGPIPQLSDGQLLKVRGTQVEHPKYGPQIKVENVEIGDPVTEDGIQSFLESGMIEGIGTEYAGRIVDRFGKETIQIIDEHPEKLLDIPGIGQKRANKIKSSWDKQKKIRDAMMFLQSHGISANFAMKICKKYRDDTIRKVRANPYRLVLDIHGIGFQKADTIARKMGIPSDSLFRVEAGVRYTLRDASSEGHVYLPRPELVGKSADLLAVGHGLVEKAIESLQGKSEIAIYDNNAIYDERLDRAEKVTALFLLGLIGEEQRGKSIDFDKEVCIMEDVLGIRLDGQQREAVVNAVKEKVVVITGGPGTGKTTIIKFVLGLCEKMNLTAALAAPTGRAAKRMEEATGLEAMTIHRLLGFSPDGAFLSDENSPISADVVIIDESSMIDTYLMSALVRAIPPDSTVIFVGDVDQLPSVGPGNVLKDIIASGMVHVARLDKIYRQEQNSSIVLNSHAINRGEMPSLATTRDFRFVKVDDGDPEMVLRYVLTICKGHGGEVQVLSPMHRGMVGVKNLNVVLQKALNPDGMEFKVKGRVFRVGDKVLQMVNDYEKEVFNGDIGRILRFSEEDKTVNVEFDGRSVEYQYAEFDEIELAYAMTVHKSQGSEYPIVVMILVTSHFVMLQRNLVYTGLTRAKEGAMFVGSVKALAIAIKNDGVRKRYSGLSQRLTGSLRKIEGNAGLFDDGGM